MLGGAVGERVRRVVDKSQLVDADLFAHAPREKGAALGDLLTRQRAGEDPEQRGRHPAVEDGGYLRAPGLLRPEKTRRAVNGIDCSGVDVEIDRSAADRVAEACLGVVPIAGNGLDEEIAAGAPTRHLDPTGGRDRLFTEAVEVVGGDDLAYSRVSGSNAALEIEGKRNLVVGRERDELLPPEIEHRRFHAVGRGEPGMLVDRGECGIVAGLAKCLHRGELVELPHVGEALSSCRNHPHAHAGRLGGRELLDGALEGPDRGLPATGDIDLALLTNSRPFGDPPCQPEELRHLRYRRS